MLRSVFGCLFLTMLMLGLPAPPAQAQVLSILGKWTGTASQNSGESGYKVVINITEHGGTTDYPGLKCGGTLVRVGTADGFVFFSESITRGSIESGGDCIDGTITVAQSGKELIWGWVGHHDGEIYVGWSKLSRK